MSLQLLAIMVLLVAPVTSNILMPHSFFATRSDIMLEDPSGQAENVDASPIKINSGSNEDIGSDKSDSNFQTEHARNCFFTPVQCLLPLTDSHKDVQSLHGVYSPTATHVRRSVDTMLTSPWGYTDLIKRGGDNRFYQWLSRF
ncbi:Protein CBG22713 [Caenorhabditis briggsae]|uniref:Uncharacterized protein n=2 Tax=Caenorhabditis briggsae TaxID=6238 RepID=A0AAE8ZXD1_CAEBR|nr:Protein CBG22713 [Caenorhabditis briggsae]ULT84115.1 hypothetical protein L3Y34_013030 [Caenorhabditis briggsae]CAP39243.1 Protein CBG22713 [Caenorhabditis briggsae]